MIAYTYRHFSFLTFIFKLHTIKIHTECSWSVVINPFAYKQIAEEMRVENSIVYGNVHLLHLPQLMLTVVLVQYYTLIAWLRGEHSNCCPEVGEKTWETVAQGRRSSPLPRDNNLSVS